MIYLDSSLVVTALTHEPSTAAAQTWLSRQAASDLHVSWWVDTEVASALAQKQRAGALRPKQRVAALGRWRALLSGLSVAPVEQRHFAAAADLTMSGLRAADALHLAIARDLGAELATRDAALVQAARENGVVCHQLP